MASSRAHLPPRNLVALILGITVAPLATLLWLGWRLLEQDRMLAGQQVQQRVERAADLVVAVLQRAVAGWSRRRHIPRRPGGGPSERAASLASGCGASSGSRPCGLLPWRRCR